MSNHDQYKNTKSTEYHFYRQVQNSSAYQDAKKQYISALREKLEQIKAPSPPNDSLKEEYKVLISQLENVRGRELFYKFIGSGAGNGPFVELRDGSIKYDLITGIGVNFFGYGNIDLLEAQLDSIWCCVMQGNLSPGSEYKNLMEALLECVGSKSNLKHVWLTSCGATANENALKMIRQKKYPASKIMTFKGTFAGRTTALQEITDNPKYREGQPTYGEVFYIPFYDAHSKKSAAEQAQDSIQAMKEEINRYPGSFACLEFELVQGEGGFYAAPKEFIFPIVKEAKKLGLAIWVDEIQTFGRTGEIFCYQKVGLEEEVDVVTIAKLLQVGAVIFSAEYNPKPGLVSGTFAGSSAGLSAGIKTLELLKQKFIGSKGRIQHLENLTFEEFKKIQEGKNSKFLVDYTVVGGMIAFTLFDGKLDQVKKFLSKLWDLGVMAFYCGHGPYRVRMLPPFGVLTDDQWKDIFHRIDQAIHETAVELKIL